MSPLLLLLHSPEERLGEFIGCEGLRDIGHFRACYLAVVKAVTADQTNHEQKLGSRRVVSGVLAAAYLSVVPLIDSPAAS